MRQIIPALLLIALASLARAQQDEVPAGLWCFTETQRESQRATEQGLLDSVSTDRLREYHELSSADVHPAGSEGDRRLISDLEDELTRMGLRVEVQWFEALLAAPVSASLQLMHDGETHELPIREEPVEGDKWSADEDRSIGWNAFSASGTVEAEYVYANYARWQDFEKLEELGIDVKGKIVLARYGGNYRGFKAHFAEKAGAIGLVMFTDPRNSGPARGPVYPEGGWANEQSIQRGSILVAPYPGDPLTPGVFASKDAPRIAMEDAPLPKIISQPIGYAAAEPLLKAMTGEPVPEAWQGGIDTQYRLTSGDARIRLEVQQTRTITRTANVIASVIGEREPHLEVIAGCHHDAWTQGASDPGAGTMVLLELARIFGERAQQGERPARTMRFAFWGAEEHGIIGSTEYVESRERELGLGCIAYINLDMAAMGHRFGASASPNLAQVIKDAAASVDSLTEPGMSMLDDWRGDTLSEPRVGVMGGGSDHVAFQCRAGVPCMALSMRGAQGVSYHSAHDTLAWYRRVVGDDYKSAQAVTRVGALIMSRLANATVLPLEPWKYGDVCARAHEELIEEINALDQIACADLHITWDRWQKTEEAFGAALQRVLNGEADATIVNSALMRCDRAWVEREGKGLPGREWYRNHFAAPDERSGYSAWTLPGVRAALARDDARLLLKMSQIVESASRKAEEAALSVSPIADRWPTIPGGR